MKDGRTHLAHKAEHAVDLETGAIVGVTVQGADQGDTTTIAETVTTTAEELEAVAVATDGHTAISDEVVADKGYHSKADAGGSRDTRPADLYRGARSRPAQLDAPGGGARRGVRESSTHPGRAWVGLVASTE